MENISRILNFAAHDLPRNTAKIGRRENFPFYGIVNIMENGAFANAPFSIIFSKVFKTLLRFILLFSVLFME